MEVVLIGKGLGKELAPKQSNSIAVWGVNDTVALRGVDVCFWMDRHLMKDMPMDITTVNGVNTSNTLMYSAQAWEDIPTCKPYPRDEVFEFFGTDYFADSLCYMVALAIYQGFSTISLYGFNYSHGSKYVGEKPAVMYWLGVAMGKGIKVNVYGEYSELFDTVNGKVYSYEDEQLVTKIGMKLRQTDTFDTPVTVFNLSTKERILIIGLLPVQGDYSTMKLANEVRDKVKFSSEEQIKANIREIAPQSKNPGITWNVDEDIPDKECEFTGMQYTLIRSSIGTLDTDKKITPLNFDLYERFCSREHI